MAEQDAFELRLVDALRAYVLEAPTELDPLALAHLVAARHRRRRAGGLVPWPRQVARPVLLILIAAALLILLLATLTAGGALRPRNLGLEVLPSRPLTSQPSEAPSDRPVSTGVPGVGDVYGEWQADVSTGGSGIPSGTYTLDLNAPAILRGPDGTAVGWAGRTVSLTASEDGAFEVLVHASEPCGDGRYTLREAGGSHGSEGPGPSASAAGAVAPPSGFWEFFRLTPQADRCAARVALLAAGSWERMPLTGPRLGPFTPGGTYASGVFTEPFTFVMPQVDASGENAGLPDQFRFASRYVADGGLWFGGPWWGMAIVDDLPVSADLCNRNGPIMTGIPSTPREVVDWYRSSGFVISEPEAVVVDGRAALRFDVGEAGEPCNGGRFPLGGWFAPMSRVYAIPTPDDTILVAFGSDGVNWEAVKEAVDALVRSIRFD